MSILGGLHLESNYVSANGNTVGSAQQNVLPEGVQNAGSTDENRTLSGLAVGDTLTGEMISREDDTVELLLKDNTLIQAKLDRDLQMQPGQMITFTVKNTGNGNISLAPLFTNTTDQKTAAKALMNAGMPASKNNMKMVSSMMQEGLPIGKDALSYMRGQWALHPETEITTLVQMHRMGIPMTENNIEQFSAYKNYEHQILDAANHIGELVGNTLVELAETAPGEARALFDTVLGMIVEETNAVPETVVKSEQTMGLEKNGLINNSGAEESVATPVQEQSGQDRNADIKELFANSVEKDFQNQEVIEVGNPAERLEHSLTGAGLSKELVQDFLQGKVSVETILKQPKTGLQGEENITRLLGNKEFGKILGKAFTDAWKLTAEQTASKEEVKELYCRMEDQTRQMMDAIRNTVKADSPLANAVTKLQNNLDFMNQLNQMFPYVQLPLALSQSEAHGELYVYANKKNMAKENGVVSALLHLDMEHLGTVDVMVKMNAEQHVTTDFMVADEGVLDLIEAHIEELVNRLQKRGYQMDATCSLQVDNKSVMERMIEKDRNISTVSVTSFDARA